MTFIYCFIKSEDFKPLHTPMGHSPDHTLMMWATLYSTAVGQTDRGMTAIQLAPPGPKVTTEMDRLGVQTTVYRINSWYMFSFTWLILSQYTKIILVFGSRMAVQTAAAGVEQRKRSDECFNMFLGNMQPETESTNLVLQQTFQTFL